MRRWWAFGALVVLAACNELPKKILAGPALRPEARARGAATGSLEVVYTSPASGGEEVREVVALFNRPMATRETPIALRPEVAGETRWIGEHALVFLPREPLPEGRYTAIIAPTARTADGVELGSAHQWTFLATRAQPGKPQAPAAMRERQPLRIWSAWVDGARALTGNREVRVTFSGPVRLEDLARLARFVLPDGKSVALTARYLRPRNQRAVLLKPAEALPRGSDLQVKLQIDAGLPAISGAAPLSKPYERDFPTIVALSVPWILCPSSPHGSLGLSFSDEVDAGLVLSQLRIEPAVKLRLLTDQTSGRRVSLGGPFVPGQRYRIEVPAGLSGKEAGPLPQSQVQECEISAPKPTLRFAVQGSLVERAAPKPIPLWAELVPKVAVSLRLIPEDKAVAVIRSRTAADPLPVVHRSTLSGDGSSRRQLLVDPSPALAQGQGLVLIEVEGLDSSDQTLEGTRSRFLLNATDLGLTTKQSTASTVVWVTRLSTGEPVAGATVTVRDGKGEALGSATSDADGVAEVPTKVLNLWNANYVFARKDGDLAWLRTDENQWMFMPSSFDVPEWSSDESWSPGEPPVLRGLLFTERGIYRPGETVRLKGILRKETSGLETAPGTPVRVSVRDSKDEEVFSRELTSSEFGTFSLEVPLSEGAALGAYRAEVRAGTPEWRRALSRLFRVEEFRTPDFEVKVRPDRRDWFPGETPRVTVEGRYFFGAKMRRAPVSYTVTAADSWFTPPKHPGYVWRPGVSMWDRPEREPSSRQVVSDEGYLDDRGEYLIEIPKAEANRVYTVEAKVRGIDRTEIAGRTAVVSHPASFYLGVLAEWTFMEMTETFRGDLVAVSPDGTRVPGIPIEGVIYQGDWDSVRKVHEGGTASFTTSPAPKEAGRCRLTSGAAPARCEFKPRAGGQYVLWASAKDQAGRKVETALEFYVLGPTTTSWAASDSVKITLRADRHEYRVGETARILVQNPFPEAEALVTIERERVLQRFRQKLVGPAPALRLPVTEDLMPNVYVSVALVRGRVPGPFQVTGDDPRRPLMRVGHALLRISPESRRMKVEVSPERDEYRPGEEVTVRLRSTGPDGKPLPAELTVWAVDEGVLSLVAYKTPDPVPAFHALRALGIMTSDTRYRYLRRLSFEEKGQETGGGGGAEGGETVRRKVFKAVAFFDPSVRTDDAGEAAVRFVLPDNMTTFRVMAVAVTKEQRFGSGEAKIVSTKRLLLQPSLPRFLRAGDQIEAGVVVHNRTREPGEVQVRLTAEGLVLGERGEKTVRVGAGQGVEVRFPLRGDKPGVAKLTFDARLGVERDGLEVTRVVHPPTVLESVGLSGEAKDEAVRHSIGPVAGARGDVGGLDVVLSGSRLAGVAAGLSSLLEYPYGCAEQTTSKLLPLIALRDVAEVTGEGLKRDAGAMIRAGLQRLATFQRDNGGFGLWPGGSEVDPWVSAYVMFALAEAKTRGVEVEARVQKAGTSYLQKMLRQSGRIDQTMKAYALYALASLGAAEAPYAATLYDQREKLGPAGRAVLARALLRMGDTERATTLVTDLVGSAQPSGETVRFPPEGRSDWRYYGSALRTQALVLEVLAAFEPGHALVPLLANALLAAREGGRWRTTQEAAYALFALASAERAEAATSGRSVKVFVNGKRRLAASFGPGESPFRKLWIPMPELPGGAADLVILPKGGPIRYSARLVHAPVEPPRVGRDDGLALARTYESVAAPEGGVADFGAPSATEVPAGGLVRVTLHVLVPTTLRHVVVDDPLPAGLEAVNVALSTEAKAGQEPERDRLFTHRELRDDRVVLYAPTLKPGLYRRSYLARATTPGRFLAPAVRAEAMYQPEWAGSTAASTLSVVMPAAKEASK